MKFLLNLAFLDAATPGQLGFQDPTFFNTLYLYTPYFLSVSGIFLSWIVNALFLVNPPVSSASRPGPITLSTLLGLSILVSGLLCLGVNGYVLGYFMYGLVKGGTNMVLNYLIEHLPFFFSMYKLFPYIYCLGKFLFSVFFTCLCLSYQLDTVV